MAGMKRHIPRRCTTNRNKVITKLSFIRQYISLTLLKAYKQRLLLVLKRSSTPCQLKKAVFVRRQGLGDYHSLPVGQWLKSY